MEIKSQFEHGGQIHKVTYRDGVPESASAVMLNGVHAYCFYNEKLVVVHHSKDGAWTPPGGAIEKGETYEEASIREVKEESNMKVLYQECIGYQDVEIPGENKTVRQIRMFCTVEPYGDFETDPDGDIDEIRLIDPKEYKDYIQWGEIGDHLMQRALELQKLSRMI